MEQAKGGNLRLYILMLWMAVVPLTSSGLITIVVFQFESTFQNLSGEQWVLFFFISTFTMALAITPTTYIALLAGYFIDLWAIVPLVLAYQLASVVGFLIAKKLDNGFINDIITKYPKAHDIVKNVESNQLKLTVLSRLSPALPFALMNVILSASQIRLSQFFWGGFIGMLPRTLFFIWVGIQASNFSEAFHDQENLYLSGIITILVLLVMFKILRSPRKY